MFSQDQVIRAFADRLAEYGIALSDPGALKLDGQWHRADVQGDRKRSGNLSYKIYFDDRPAGYFEDHKRGVTGTFSVSNGENTDPAERAAAQARWREQQAQREQEQAERYRLAAERAAGLYAIAQPAPADHPYLVRKQLAPTPGLKLDAENRLLIPVYSDFGVLASLQTIDADGAKLFLPGGRMAGSFHPINGPDKTRVLVCEGYATGAALKAATDCSVACAMSAGNFAAIVRKMQAKFPGREIVACVDNDHETESRTGKNPGVEAAADLGVRVLVPQFPPNHPGTDWDDWLRDVDTASAFRALLDGDPPKTAPEAAQAEPEPAAATLPAKPRSPRPAKSAQPMTVAEPVEPPPSQVYDKKMSWEQLDLIIGDRGAPIPNLDNAARLLERHPEVAGRFWFDEFLQRMLTSWTHDGEPREWSDSDDVRLALWMQRKMGIGRMAVGTARDAVVAVGMAHRRNECREWLESLTWDGTPRLHTLLPIGFGTEANPYTEAVGRCWLISMAARVLDPGCKVDNMPVFEGAQGKMKSTGLQVLVGARWFAEAAESPLSKDFFQALQGKMLVEIGEMDAFSRSEVHTIKRVVSCQNDRYRAPYGRRSEDHPRQNVFAGTTNKDDWNRDDTGARRFWPAACSEVDLAWLARWREQLFAEAVAAFRTGACWWDVPKEDAEREQEARRQTDEWEPIIADWLLMAGSETTVGDVLTGALKMDVERWDKVTQMRAASCLRVLGWKRVTVRRGLKVLKLWQRVETGGNDELL